MSLTTFEEDLRYVLNFAELNFREIFTSCWPLLLVGGVYHLPWMVMLDALNSRDITEHSSISLGHRMYMYTSQS